MRIEWFYLKMIFRRNYELFLTKNQEILNVRKNRNYDEERVFVEEKTSHLWEKLTKLGRRKICRC